MWQQIGDAWVYFPAGFELGVVVDEWPDGWKYALGTRDMEETCYPTILGPWRSGHMPTPIIARREALRFLERRLREAALEAEADLWERNGGQLKLDADVDALTEGATRGAR